MPFNEAFEPELAKVMARAMADARDLAQRQSGNIELEEAARHLMVMRIMTAVAAGERDQARLTAIAYDAVRPRPALRETR